MAAANPEVVKRLRALAEKMDADLGQDGRGPGCREPGRIENPRPIIDHDGAVRPEFAKSQN